MQVQAPSYTFLMGEYVSFLKVQLASPKLDFEARKFYTQRLQQLMSFNLEDLPLFKAEQITVSKEVRELLQKALY